MVENIKVGLRIIISLPVLILLLLIVIAVGVPALIGYLISMGVHVLSKNAIKKLPPSVQGNPFFEVLWLLIFTPILAIGCSFYLPAVIASLPLIAFLEITEYLAGRRLNKIGYQIT